MGYRSTTYYNNNKNTINNVLFDPPQVQQQQQRHHQQAPHIIPPRLRKRWYGNPFRNHIRSQSSSQSSSQQQQQQHHPFQWWDTLWNRRREQDQLIMRHNQQHNQDIFQNSNHTITLQDLTDLRMRMRTPPFHDPPQDLRTTRNQSSPFSSSSSSSSSSSPYILDMVQQRMGIPIDAEIASMLPTWEQVTALYGRHPVLYGIHNSNTCTAYRDRMMMTTTTTTIVPQSIHPEDVHPLQRYIGVAGQMNTGTNALAKYLLQNIYLPSPSSATNSEHDPTTVSTTTMKNNNINNKRGILWTVPWYKHSWSSLYQQYHYDDGRSKQRQKNHHHHKNVVAMESLPTDHSHVLAVVLIRDPYFWMQR